MTYETAITDEPVLLVADDDADIRSILVDVLKEDGHAVEWAECGAGLLSRLSRRPDPSLVLTDLKMPWLDGLEVLERAARVGLQVPAILFTGHLDHDVHQRARALQVPVLPKPLDLSRLREEVSTVLDAQSFWAEPEHDGYWPIRPRSPRRAG